MARRAGTRILDAGDDRNRPVAGQASVDVDAEYALRAHRPKAPFRSPRALLLSSSPPSKPEVGKHHRCGDYESKGHSRTFQAVGLLHWLTEGNSLPAAILRPKCKRPGSICLPDTPDDTLRGKSSSRVPATRRWNRSLLPLARRCLTFGHYCHSMDTENPANSEFLFGDSRSYRVIGRAENLNE